MFSTSPVFLYPLIFLALPLLFLLLVKKKYPKSLFAFTSILLFVAFFMNFGKTLFEIVSLVFSPSVVWFLLTPVVYFKLFPFGTLFTVGVILSVIVYIVYLKRKISLMKKSEDLKSVDRNISLFEKIKKNSKDFYLLRGGFILLPIYTIFLYVFLHEYNQLLIKSCLYLFYLIIFVVIFFIFRKYKYWQILKHNKRKAKLGFFAAILFAAMIFMPLLKLNCYSHSSANGSKIDIAPACDFIVPELVKHNSAIRSEGKGPSVGLLPYINGQLAVVLITIPYLLLILGLYLSNGDRKKKKVLKK